jgi:hypothetical protein
MEIKTAEQIASLTDDLEGKANRTAINKLYREQDESNLWPINGDFNATDKAIRKAQQFMREGGYDLQGLEYCYFLEEEISRIVNSY